MNQPANDNQRIVSRDGEWYFKVRNEQVEGPFASEAEARAALQRYVRRCEGRYRFSLRSLLGPDRAA